MADKMTDTQPKASPAAEMVVDANETAKEKAARRRNFSFLHKKPDTLDEVEIDGKTYKIPAAAGSCYWAVLKVCYESHDEPVYPDELCKKVAELMEDRDERAWQNYTAKTKTTVLKSVEGSKTRAIQPIRTWQERVINNAKTLTRLGGNSQYGMRLYERGHVLRYDYDGDGKPYFILRTSLDCFKTEKTVEQEE